jgi:hypothetical protein
VQQAAPESIPAANTSPVVEARRVGVKLQIVIAVISTEWSKNDQARETDEP